MSQEKFECFEKAFSSHSSTCRFECPCGKIYFDNYNTGYSWEDGELEELVAGKGIPVCGSIGGVEFEGKSYAECCDCWKERAQKIMRFIDGHRHQIAEYLSLEKERMQRAADDCPTVKGGAA